MKSFRRRLDRVAGAWFLVPAESCTRGCENSFSAPNFGATQEFNATQVFAKAEITGLSSATQKECCGIFDFRRWLGVHRADQAESPSSGGASNRLR